MKNILVFDFDVQVMAILHKKYLKCREFIEIYTTNYLYFRSLLIIHVKYYY